jgi:hypothetical protein
MQIVSILCNDTCDATKDTFSVLEAVAAFRSLMVETYLNSSAELLEFYEPPN